MKFIESNLNEITEFGKKAVAELRNNDFKKYEEYAEKGFNIFPGKIKDFESKDIKTKFFDLGYRYIKMIFKGFFDNKNLKTAKKWLDRLEIFNNFNHLFDEEVNFFKGKYFYENGNFNEAYNEWKDVVKNSGKNQKRYFEGEDKKYWEFYMNQKKTNGL